MASEKSVQSFEEQPKRRKRVMLAKTEEELEAPITTPVSKSNISKSVPPSVADEILPKEKITSPKPISSSNSDNELATTPKNVVKSQTCKTSETKVI